MADRTVKVSLILAATGYMQGMDAVAKKTAQTGTEIEKLAQKRQALTQLGAGFTAMGVAAGAGVALAVSKFAEFDQQMSYVKARTHETAANMDLLRDAALDAGARTVFSATEAAAAIEELAAAGVSTKDVLAGGLDAALDLAAAGGLAVADAAQIAAVTLNQFKLEGREASHVADLLAAGAGEAVGEVTDMAAALNQGGLVADQFGLSLEETTGTLAAFAANSLIGSDAGTSFRTMLLRLANPTEEVKGLMADIGFEAYNAQGQFIGLSGLAGELETSLAGMTDEQKQTTLAMIFGQDAIRASTILLEEGADGIAEWTEKVDQQGYAAETASMRLDNLAGDVEALGGAFDTAFIQSGSGANDALRALVQSATSALDTFNDLPEPLQQTAIWVGASAAGVALLGGAALLAVPKLAEFRTSMHTLGVTGAGVRRRMGSFVQFLGGPYGIAMLAATAAAIAFNKAIEAGVPSQAQITNSVQKSASAMDMLRAATERGQFEKNVWGDYADQLEDLPGLLDRASEAGWRWAELSFNEQGALDSLDRLGDSLGEMARTNLPAATDAFSKLVDEFALTDEQAMQLLREMPEFRDALLEQATAAGVVADDHELLRMATEKSTAATKTSAQAYQDAAKHVADMESELSGLIDTINEVNGVGQDAITANLDYRDALADVDEYIRQARDGADGYSLTLDETTQAGRDNMSMLVDLAREGQEAAKAQFDADQNTEAYRRTLEDSRQALLDRAEDLGYTAEQATSLADEIFRIPSETEWELIADTQQAQSAISQFVADASAKTITIGVTTYKKTGEGLEVHVGDQVANAAGGYYSGGVKAFAAGGFASGIYRHRPGGIHKFAEAGDEAYISFLPQYRDRNLRIAEESLRRLGAYQPAPSITVSGGSGGGTYKHTTNVTALPGMTPGQLISAANAASEFEARRFS